MLATNLHRRLFALAAPPFLVALLIVPAMAQTPVVAPGNTGLAGFLIDLRDDQLLLSLSEQSNGADFNGDGDLSDSVPHLEYLATGSSLTIPMAGGAMFDSGNERFLVLSVSEMGEQTDFSGDGDLNEPVIHIQDLRTGALQNIGYPFEGPRFNDELLVFTVRETQHGNTDLNGDGDIDDRVLHVHSRSTGVTTNTGLAISYYQELTETDTRYVVFAVLESGQGEQDLNGDGDSDDQVLAVFDARTGMTRNLGLVSLLTSDSWARVGSRLVVHTTEESLGIDVDGDGVLEANVTSFLDPATGVVSPTELTWGFYPPFSVISGGTFVYASMREFEQINAPFILHRIDGATGQDTDLGVNLGSIFDVFEFPVVGRYGALLVRETTLDLNSDGDLFDLVLHVLDTRTGVMKNIGLASIGVLDIKGDILTFLVRESSQGGLDRNGDGDKKDYTQSILDLRTGELVHLPYASEAAFAARRLIAFGVSEKNQGFTDLNGDGDLNDVVLHVYDLRRKLTSLLGVGNGALVDGPYIAFSVDESDAGTGDLNGDGDIFDRVIHVTKL